MDAGAGLVCWADLAASDAGRAKEFYARMFGWTARDQAADAGTFTRLQLAGTDVASLYQLDRANIEHGVPSHWTLYIRVPGVDEAVPRAIALGARTVVEPVTVSGIARVAVIADPVGALVGLWEDLRPPQARVAR